MIKIGDFSRLTLVKVRTLRHYADIGLFEPAHIDEQTGYRYYSANQLPRLNRLLALKDMGFSLDEISKMLDGELPLERIKNLFHDRQRNLEHTVVEEQARLERVRTRIRLIEMENQMTEYDVVIKDVPDQTIASIKSDVKSPEEAHGLFMKLHGVLVKNSIDTVGPPTAIYPPGSHDKDYKHSEDDHPIEVAFPVSENTGHREVGSSDRVKIRVLKGDKMASVVHSGSYEGIQAAGHMIMNWIETNGYRISDQLRGLYHTNVEDTPDASKFVTEIQVPIEKV